MFIFVILIYRGVFSVSLFHSSFPSSSSSSFPWVSSIFFAALFNVHRSSHVPLLNACRLYYLNEYLLTADVLLAAQRRCQHRFLLFFILRAVPAQRMSDLTRGGGAGVHEHGKWVNDCKRFGKCEQFQCENEFAHFPFAPENGSRNYELPRRAMFSAEEWKNRDRTMKIILLKIYRHHHQHHQRRQLSCSFFSAFRLDSWQKSSISFFDILYAPLPPPSPFSVCIALHIQPQRYCKQEKLQSSRSSEKKFNRIILQRYAKAAIDKSSVECVRESEREFSNVIVK